MPCRGGPTPVTRHVLVAALLAALVVLSYANSLRGGFVLDNRAIILGDPRLRAATSENLGLVFTRDYWWPHYVGNSYRPVTTLSYLLNYAVLGNGERPLGYHLVNVVLHWANAVLVYVVALGLLGDASPAVWTAAVFAAHPIATEAVANIVGRADLLAALFLLSGLLFHLKSTKTRGWRRVPWLGGLIVASTLGVLSKESGVALLGVLVWYDCMHPTRLRVAAADWVVVLLPLALLWALRVRLYAGLPPPLEPFVDNPLRHADFWTARATAIGVLARYAALLVWPQHLSSDYSYDQIPLVAWRLDRAGDLVAVAGVGLVGAAIGVALGVRRRHPALAFFVGFSFLTLLPTANLLRIIGSIMAERFLYLPSVGFAACLVIGVRAACRRPPAAGAFLAALVLAYGVRTWARNRDWQDDLSLSLASVASAPASFKLHHGLARAQRLAGRPDLAIPEAERAIAILDARRLAPEDVPSGPFIELGLDLWVRGEQLMGDAKGPLAAGDDRTVWFEKAAVAFARAAGLDRAYNVVYRRRSAALRGQRAEDVPDVGNRDIYRYQGQLALRLGRPAEALEAFAYVCHLAPADPAGYRALARAALAAERRERAAVAVLQALAVDANDQEARRLLVEVYEGTDDGGCALTAVEGRLRLNLDCPRVHADLCTALGELADAFTRVRDAQRARQVEEAAQRSGCTSRTR